MATTRIGSVRAIRCVMRQAPVGKVTLPRIRRDPPWPGWCRDAREGDRRRNNVVQTHWLMPHESATPQPSGQYRRAYQGPGLFRPHHMSCPEPPGSQCTQACCCPTHIALRRPFGPCVEAWRIVTVTAAVQRGDLHSR